MSILDNNPERKEGKIFINEVLSEKIIWKNLVNEIKESYGGIGFFYVFIKLSKNKEEIVKFYIYFLKILNACFVRFDFKELKDFSEENIAKNSYISC